MHRRNNSSGMLGESSSPMSANDSCGIIQSTERGAVDYSTQRGDPASPTPVIDSDFPTLEATSVPTSVVVASSPSPPLVSSAIIRTPSSHYQSNSIHGNSSKSSSPCYPHHDEEELLVSRALLTNCSIQETDNVASLRNSSDINFQLRQQQQLSSPPQSDGRKEYRQTPISALSDNKDAAVSTKNVTDGGSIAPDQQRPKPTLDRLRFTSDMTKAASNPLDRATSQPVGNLPGVAGIRGGGTSSEITPSPRESLSPRDMQFSKQGDNAREDEGPSHFVYQVQFKREHRCYLLGANAPFSVAPGDFVVVEADRGEDLGVVVSMAPTMSAAAAMMIETCNEAACRGSPEGPDHTILRPIRRPASPQDRRELAIKWEHEMEVLEVAQARARNVYQLPIAVVDAEYQFDRRKLTIYYSAARRVDFRELVRDLFTMYKTRIWMEHITTAHMAFRPSPAAARALATGLPCIQDLYSAPLAGPSAASLPMPPSRYSEPSLPVSRASMSSPSLFVEEQLDYQTNNSFDGGYPHPHPHRRQSTPLPGVTMDRGPGGYSGLDHRSVPLPILPVNAHRPPPPPLPLPLPLPQSMGSAHSRMLSPRSQSVASVSSLQQQREPHPQMQLQLQLQQSTGHSRRLMMSDDGSGDHVPIGLRGRELGRDMEMSAVPSIRSHVPPPWAGDGGTPDYPSSRQQVLRQQGSRGPQSYIYPR